MRKRVDREADKKEMRKMTIIKKVEKNNGICAVVESDELVIRDAESALDLLMRVKYEADTKDIVLAKKWVHEDFFILSTGLAGEVLQKFINLW